MMNELNEEQKKTFQNLQKPTMSLIASFYESPEEIKNVFADMMAIYEANPTEETAKALSDKVMGRENIKDKKIGFSMQLRQFLRQYVSKQRKNTLMNNEPSLKVFRLPGCYWLVLMSFPE